MAKRTKNTDTHKHIHTFMATGLIIEKNGWKQKNLLPNAATWKIFISVLWNTVQT